jgi:hypothetical protein
MKYWLIGLTAVLTLFAAAPLHGVSVADAETVQAP